jgi:hypothetical protein
MLLGDRTVMDARGDPELVNAVAEVTNLAPATVRRRVQLHNGGRLLRTEFDARWPGLIDELGAAPVSEIRGDDVRIDKIARMLAIRSDAVRAELENGNRRRPVRAAFGERWPDPMAYDKERLGDLRVVDAREYGFAEAIGRAIGLDSADVRRRLRQHGSTLVRTLFERWWGEPSWTAAVDDGSAPRHIVGTELANRYLLTDHLGGGGYGEVWRATDKTLGLAVARVLKFDHHADAAQIRREYLRAHRLTHPNICKYVDVASDAATDETFIVMDYGGEPLARRLRGSPIDIATAFDWTRALGNALDFMHDERIVHRDVSPANVVIDERRIRLIDFGVAEEIPPQGVGTAANGAIAATSAYGCHRVYSAPDIHSGGRAVPATDQYSLAVVFCSMLVGRVFNERIDVAVVPPGLSARVRSALRRALQPSPDDRFPSCAAFTQALE